MKAKWVNIVDSLQGNVDQRHYARQIPGNGEWAAVCAKPELSKKTKKAKAEHPTAKAFAELMAETSATTTRRITSSSNPSHPRLPLCKGRQARWLLQKMQPSRNT